MVDEEVARSLEDSWGPDCSLLLEAELDKSWGSGWQDNPDTAKNEWLATLLTQGSSPRPGI